MVDYKINKNTLAIVPFENRKSKVYENSEVLIIDNTPNNIISSNCLINGSSLDGRLKSTQLLTGYTYKAPILVKEDDKLIFFPSSSPRLKKCSWICLNNVDLCEKTNNRSVCKIIFNNKVSIEIFASNNIINNQLYRSTRLEHNLMKKVA